MTQTESQSDNPTDQPPATVLPDGADIEFTDERDTHCPDRVEFLPGGFVKAIYKRSYQIEVYPPGVIEGIYTHTEYLEDEEWW